jgi:hypothetical protein
LFLLLSLVSSATAAPSEILLKLSYQSKGISFSDWVSLFTLCLTPLAVHVIAGTPDVVCLYYARKHLNWHQRFSQYNPTTIVWRYFAIADRRIRAKEWNAADMAASNALFWTPRGWDGSEEMIQRSRPYCLKLPDEPRATLFSKSSVNTAVITIQGVQAMAILIGGFTKGATSNFALDTIFSPLAVLGLLRLCAAPWLTDDYSYAEHEDRSTTPALRERTDGSKTLPYVSKARAVSSMGLFEPEDDALETRFHPVDSWRGRLFRIFFLIPVLFLWVMCFLFLFYDARGDTLTLFLINIFFMLFLSATVTTYAYYFVRGRSATTVIPCIVSTWYQIYTGILMLIALVLIVVAALETRKTKCGSYTTWPVSLTRNDEWICKGRYVSSNSTTGPFGIAMRYVAPRDNISQLPQGEYRIEEWDGLCIGTGGANQYAVAMNNSSYAG